MNYSLLGADRATHFKIAAVALVAVAVIVAAGINVHLSDPGAGARLKVDDVVVKAGKPAMYTVREIAAIH